MKGKRESQNLLKRKKVVNEFEKLSHTESKSKKGDGK